MRIKIIANNPPDDISGYSDITEYIGNEYEIPEENIIKLDPTGRESTGVYIEELYIEVYEPKICFNTI
jgi:hypothetical protein